MKLGSNYSATLPHVQGKLEQTNSGAQESIGDNRRTIQKSTLSCGVVGSSNSALALSAYLSSQGYPVHILARDINKIERVFQEKRVVAVGKLEGAFKLDMVTSVRQDFVAKCDVIFLATVTTAYADVIAQLAPYLRPGQVIILFSSKLCGAVLVENLLAQHGIKSVTVLETDALFACRKQQDESVWIRGFKNWTLYSGSSRAKTKEFGHLIEYFFPGLEPAANPVQRGLTDFGALAHPLTMLANLNTIDKGHPFLFYYEGFTERTVTLLEQMEKEFAAIATAYGAPLISMTELLNRYYGCETGSLLRAMQTVPNYRFSYAPDTLDHRYLQEDVACTLVPAMQLAQIAGVKTPLITSVVNLASAIGNVNFEEQGRTLANLNLAGLSHQEVVYKLYG